MGTIPRDGDGFRRLFPAMNDDAVFVVSLRTGDPFLRFESAFGTVERYGPTFEGCVGNERIGKLRAARVADDKAHRVLDIDVLPEDAPIADVPVVLLDVVVEPGIVMGADVEVKLASVLVVARAAPFAAFLPRGTVELQRAQSKHLHGILAEPPVDHVEMMAAFANEQPSRLFLAAMPSAKKISAVKSIEQVVEIGGEHVADGSLGDEFADARRIGNEPHVKGDGDASARTPFGLEDLAALRLGDGERLLANDIAAA